MFRSAQGRLDKAASGLLSGASKGYGRLVWLRPFCLVATCERKANILSSIKPPVLFSPFRLGNSPNEMNCPMNIFYCQCLEYSLALPVAFPEMCPLGKSRYGFAMALQKPTAVRGKWSDVFRKVKDWLLKTGDEYKKRFLYKQ